MSGLAKVFVIVNFVLSIVFLSGAGMLLAKSDEWKTQYDTAVADHEKVRADLEGQIGQLRGESQTMQAQYDKVTNDLGDERNAKDKFAADLNDEKQASKELRDSVNKLQEALDNLQGNLTQSTDRIGNLEQQVDSERNRADAAVRGQTAAEDQLTRTKSQLSDAQDRIAGLESDINSMRDEVEGLALMVDAAKRAGFDTNELTAAPPINGFVKAVDMETGVFILSVGSDDGVQKGHKFYVYRGNEYLGEVYVDQVQSDLSSATARDRLEGAVKAMDQVTTRL